MVSIYILKLEHDKYYVGKSKTPIKRIQEHCDCTGSAWTSIHKPMEIIRIIEDCDEFDEDKYTKMCMNDHGIHNVRGGSYVQIHLDEHTINVLENELKSVNNLCFGCGKIGHFVRACKEGNATNERKNVKRPCVICSFFFLVIRGKTALLKRIKNNVIDVEQTIIGK